MSMIMMLGVSFKYLDLSKKKDIIGSCKKKIQESTSGMAGATKMSLSPNLLSSLDFMFLHIDLILPPLEPETIPT